MAQAGWKILVQRFIRPEMFEGDAGALIDMNDFTFAAFAEFLKVASDNPIAGHVRLEPNYLEALKTNFPTKSSFLQGLSWRRFYGDPSCTTPSLMRTQPGIVRLFGF